jgi:HEAT repeat protein
MATAETLGRVGGMDAAAIRQLTARLPDSHQSVRIAALRALGEMGAKSAAADVKLFQDRTSDPAMKVWAAATLVVLGSDEEANRRALFAALKEKAPGARSARITAIDAIAALGPNAKAAVPDLIVALKDKSTVGRKGDEQVRERAAQTLGRLRAREAVPPLIELMRDPDRRARRAAAEALGAIGPDAIVAVARLRDLARNDPAIADAALAAIDRIDPPKTTDPDQ